MKIQNKFQISFRLAGGGFTLIEILVSVSIIFLLLTISIAGYGQFNEKQKLISAGQDMKNLIRDAQNRAFNGEMDCNMCNCDSSTGLSTSFNGWFVDFDSGSIYGMCNDTPFFEKDFGVSAKITVVPHITPADKILFRYKPPSVDRKGTICLSQENLSSFFKITINNSGDVSDNGLVEVCP